MKYKGLKTVLNFIYAVLSCYSFCFLNSAPIDRAILTIPCIICLFVFYSKNNKKPDIYAILLSLVLSFFLLLGKYGVYIYESSGLALMFKILVTPIGSIIFFIKITEYLFTLFENKEIVLRDEIFQSKKALFFISFCIILLCWIPYWLLSYPGVYSPDTINQINQSLGITLMNNRNPLLHTLLIKALYNIFLIFTNDINLIFALTGFVQMIVLSIIYSLVVMHVYDITKSKILTYLTVAFYSLISFNAIYNSSISKDSVYTAFLALLVIMLVKCYRNSNLKNIIFTSVVGIVYCLMRSNGYFSLLFVMLVVCVFGKWKKTRSVMLVLISVFVGSTIIRGPIYGKIINIANKDKLIEITNEEDDGKYHFKGSFLYVMPFQQVGNVVFHERELNEKEEWLIEEYVSFEGLKQNYNPMLVDPLYEQILIEAKPSRATINNIEYVKLWVELMFKYPLDYLESYVNMTKYYFYPNRYVTPYYQGVANNDLGIERKPLLNEKTSNVINEFYETQKTLPVIGMTFSPGTTSFILTFVLFFSLRSKNTIAIIASLLYAANLLILLVGVPINDEFRYIYPIIGSLPIIISLLYIEKEREEK